ncbi:SDR family NAD(P)-dependent oxidoreductase [Paraferrimonas sedimenticola]|uniref:Beta-ketoacyl-ACP reductase n=1 Tax=Paraferrimonas sedimenticola TaxID=375674 RepID=A0AA37RVN7_9GAMM|nr:SDR family NAD(P)-dependent oxidoreductase [Paraferrimonas sedimenticola]GLP96076.1 beta-ketoacyl-ACP reductase [Paraferrimonas sedimenticola]
MKPLTGKVAIVTGATKVKGLGRAIALELAKQGASIALTGRESSKQGLEEVVQSIKDETGAIAIGVLVDVADPQQVEQAIGKVANYLGGVDILVNNAGIGAGSGVLLENTDRDWDANYAVNVKGTFAMCAGAIPEMEKRGGGSIVNVASLAGVGASVGMPYPYIATKHALVGATKALALEYGSKGITANVLAPGAIATDMLEEAYKAIAEAESISVEEAAALENSTIPLGRPAEPAEIAAAVSFLVSPAAKYVTGISVPVAGGMSAGI